MVPDYLILELLAVFGAANALAFLHVGAPFRQLFSGADDRIWFISVNSYYKDIGTHAHYMDKPWERFQLLWLGRFVHCHACLGFWIGGVYSLCLGAPLSYVVEFSFVSSAFCFITWVILKRLGAAGL